MINISKLCYSVGHRLLFDDVSCVFDQLKYGVVGRNGAGKSTLLKLIAREIKPDSGTITVRLGKRIAYLPQELTFSSPLTVFDEASTVFAQVLKLEEEKLHLEEQLAAGAGDEHLIERYLIVEARARTVDKHKIHERVASILNGLGFVGALQHKLVQELSLGWRMRLVLAKLLLQDADFYLFDEPTNHLDLVGKEWFFEFLRTASFGFLLVTHDRYFLDGACERIAEVENGEVMLYDGNFSKYVAQKEEQQLIKRASYDRQQREIEKKQATIDRFKAGTKSKMAQSMIKQLAKVERIEIEPPLPVIHIVLPPIEKPSVHVLTVKNVAYGYGDKPLFSQVNFEILRGQKVALIAPNGAGKTTLFNIIAGLLKPQHGTVIMGQYVTTALFVQDQARALNPARTIFDQVSELVDAPEKTIRAMLGSFLFTGDDAYKKIGVLSGGEKNRVAMAIVFLKKANFLLLDEPTNHLDLPSKEILSQALLKYQGTVLFVSHDQAFINKIATHIIELTPEGTHMYEGNYDMYLLTKRQQPSHTVPTATINEKTNNTSSHPPASAHKQSAHDHKRVQWLERRIQYLESKLLTLSQELVQYPYHTPDHQRILTNVNDCTKELEICTAEWHEKS
jgi:ATP-binding cassette, subfamily F, member 3